MESNIITAVLLPMALGIIMLGMGLSLTISDFKRVIIYPKAVTVGLINQIILLPMFAYILVILFGLKAELAVGIMILSACPGGATSNIIAHLSKGDTALSVTLTALSSLVTVITIPFIVNFAILEFMPNGAEQQLNVLKTVISVLVITIIPVGIGMVINSYAHETAEKFQKLVKSISIFFLIAVVLGSILNDKENIIGYFEKAGPVALALNLLMLALGLLVAKMFKLSKDQGITIAVETGIQNGTLGIALAATIIGNAEMTIPSAIYSLIMLLTGACVILIGNRGKEKKTEIDYKQE